MNINELLHTIFRSLNTSEIIIDEIIRNFCHCNNLRINNRINYSKKIYKEWYSLILRYVFGQLIPFGRMSGKYQIITRKLELQAYNVTRFLKMQK